MIKKIILILWFIAAGINPIYAKIDVVYPSKPQSEINASSFFIFGNTDNNTKFFINSKPVKLWDNNFFVETLPLEYGKNTIILRSEHKGNTEELTYTVTRNKNIAAKQVSAEFKPISENEFLFARTINDNSTIREKPLRTSNRVIDLPKDVILYLSGSKGDYYKLDTNGDSEYWIHKSNIENPVIVSKRLKLKIEKITEEEDNLYKYKKFHLNYPAMYTLKEEENAIILTLCDNDTQEYKIYFSNFILGYDCYYDDKTLVFRSAKLPKINKHKPLKGINIYIDAGHGGNESGAIGPTRICEKDINLSIANHLIKMLKADGANVSYTRTNDSKVGLYERVEKAKANNAHISVSIHNNSLPNGKDPYIVHGTEVHYYNKNAYKLAKIVQNNLANDLSLKDNGVHKSSFVLTRASNPISILVEAAYMINPEEYILLKNEFFRRNIAKSIKKSIENYILSLQN